VPFLVPQGQEGRLDAAVIIAPGGGLQFLSWNKEGTRPAKWLNSIGVSAFVLKYRVPHNSIQTQIKGITDAQRAVSFVRYKAPELALNSSHIGFMGFSAGGYLTGLVASTASRSYKPIDEVDAVSHRPDFALEIYGVGPIAEARPPPTLIVTTTNDPCVNSSKATAYHAHLEQTYPDVLHELHVFSDGHHGYGDCSLYVQGNLWEPVCAWTVNAQVFLDEVLGIQKRLSHKPMVAPPL
jgi:acetyl esterase/lipase